MAFLNFRIRHRPKSDVANPCEASRRNLVRNCDETLPQEGGAFPNALRHSDSVSKRNRVCPALSTDSRLNLAQISLSPNRLKSIQSEFSDIGPLPLSPKHIAHFSPHLRASAIRLSPADEADPWHPVWTPSAPPRARTASYPTRAKELQNLLLARTGDHLLKRRQNRELPHPLPYPFQCLPQPFGGILQPRGQIVALASRPTGEATVTPSSSVSGFPSMAVELYVLRTRVSF
jgi:hypothetical protein